MPLAFAAAPALLYRIGRLPDPFAWRPPKDGPLKQDDDPAARSEGNRFDDPLGHFPTLYLADSPLVAFVETIHNFRPRPDLRAAIEEATHDGDPDPDFDVAIASGVLPRSFADDEPGKLGRALGSCRVTGNTTLVDIADPATHVALNGVLADLLVRHKLKGFDRGVMQTQDRRITRPIAGHLHDAAVDAVGIRFPSRFTDGYCVALWDRAALTDFTLGPITHEHPELRAAAELLGIQPET